MIDAILETLDSQCRNWVQAKVISINADRIEVESLYETPQIKGDFDRWSTRLAKFLNKT